MNKNLGLLLSGQLVSQIGDKFYMIAIALWVLKSTGSPAKMGLVLFCSIFPSMLLGFVAGAVIDRYNRKAIIIIADLLRGLIICALCVMHYLGLMSFGVLLVTQVLLSVCTAFFDPAVPAIIPGIVKKENLLRANSQTQFVNGVATILGPVLGGLSVAWAGYLPVFAINAASYIISGAFEGFIRLPQKNNVTAGQTRIVDDIIEGCRYVYLRKNLVVVLIMVGVIHFFVGSIEVVIPILATELQGRGPENLGYIQAFFGIGTVLGALYLSIKKVKGKEVYFLFGGVFVVGIMLVLMGGLHLAGIRLLLPFLLLFMAVGGSVIFAGTSFRSILQKEVDDSMLGRVFGFVSSVGNISIPLATLCFGFLLEYAPQNLVVCTSGLVLLPLSLIAYGIYRSTLSQNGRA